jgi:uncharacterized protein (TIGR02246 family)
MPVARHPVHAAAAFLSLLLLLLSGCAGRNGAEESAFAREARRAQATLQALVVADNRADLGGVLACYAPEAVLTPPKGAPIKGRDAIAAHYRGIFTSQRLDVRIEFGETRVVRDAATVSGRTLGKRIPVGKIEPIPVDDDFVAELSLGDDGKWRITALRWKPH